MIEFNKELELRGHTVSLLPLSKSHRNELLLAAEDGNLWDLWYTSVPSDKNIDRYINTALNENLNGRSIPFVVKQIDTGKLIGSTRYCNIAVEHRRLEIGYTWYAKSFQRTNVNTECKLLLLQNAFENFNCGCVQFKTHSENYNSSKAIARLGAKQDGIIRNDRIMNDGRYRDTVVFSILDSEWPEIKNNLLAKLDNYK